MLIPDTEIAAAVLLVLRDIGVPESEIRADARLLKIMVDEDATFWFIPAVEKMLHIDIPSEEWTSVYTIQDAIDLLTGYLEGYPRTD